jgi:hypothetical protein
MGASVEVSTASIMNRSRVGLVCAERDPGIDTRGAPCRNNARNEANQREQDRGTDERTRIARRDTEEL